MRFFKTLGVLLLLAIPCVLLAWGTMAIGQTGASVAGSEAVPAGESVPAVQPIDSAAVLVDELLQIESRPSISFSTRRRPESDPLKEVSDLSKAADNQLQSGDQYLESQTRALAEQFAKAKDDEARAKLKGELTKTIERHFDVRHEIRKREIDQLEARVKKLREHLAKRGEARQSIVQMRLGQFISAAEGLGWDADFGGGRSSSFGGGRWSSLSPASSDPTVRTLTDEVSRQQVLETVLEHSPASQPQQSGSINLPPTPTPIEAPRR